MHATHFYLFFSVSVIDNDFRSADSENMPTLALTELLGCPVIEASGQVCGRVREVALTPAQDVRRTPGR